MEVTAGGQVPVEVISSLNVLDELVVDANDSSDMLVLEFLTRWLSLTSRSASIGTVGEVGVLIRYTGGDDGTLAAVVGTDGLVPDMAKGTGGRTNGRVVDNGAAAIGLNGWKSNEQRTMAVDVICVVHL